MSDSSLNTHAHLEPHIPEQLVNRDDAFAVTHPWIRHYEPGVPAHLEIPEQPLTWLLDCTTSRYPDRAALIYYGTRLSYNQLAGETVAAFVVLKAGMEVSEETRRELLQYCRQELAAYKMPTILEFRASLPKSLIGKVLRRELRAGV